MAFVLSASKHLHSRNGTGRSVTRVMVQTRFVMDLMQRLSAYRAGKLADADHVTDQIQNVVAGQFGSKCHGIIFPMSYLKRERLGVIC
jgi:hypothetical protein